ncbi:MAG: trypsin-like peptidase domain-containing protein [Vitreoscilla sp.]|nr:trypsin-like peptidase domain-containing protein [Vitreoscilla sp.]MBP6673990.1 trypsin-like peptidase domain-containing protein [Vitreoscilla sp.]
MTHIQPRFGIAALLAALLVSTSAQSAARGPAATASTPAAGSDAEAIKPALSSQAQDIYGRTRQKLVQIRTLLKTQESQSGVGSGFLVSEEGHLITNYHVVSQFALRPDRSRLVYVTDDGQQGPLQLLAVDVVNDLALVKPAKAGELTGRGAIAFRPASQPLPRGARVYSLGNPLDVGFTVNEGANNGLVERSFVPRLFFGGAISAGMSGGPALDEQGRLIGVNVSKNMGGEQVSFLVPAANAEALLASGRRASPITQPAYPTLTTQLMGYQEQLTERFLALPWRSASDAHYGIPVPQEQFMRCWGQGSRGEAKQTLLYERSDCNMESQIYIGESLMVGFISARHEVYDGSKIGAWRFAQRHSASFSNENFGVRTPQLTGPTCTEGTITRDGLPLRAVVCLQAYKKFAGLYKLGVLVATLDQSDAGAQGRFDAAGVSFANAMRLTQYYLAGFRWITPPASR